MAFAFVRGSGAFASTTSATIPKIYPAAVAAGNLLVAVSSWNSVSVTAQTVADDVNGAWTIVTGSLAVNSTTGWSSQVFYRQNTAAGTPTVTLTLSATTTERLLDVLEYSGGATVSPFDGGNGASGTTATATVAVAATASNDLIVAHLLANATGSAGVGYTERVATNGNETEDDLDAGAAGTINVTAADSGSNWTLTAAAFSLTDISASSPVMSPAFNAIPFTGGSP